MSTPHGDDTATLVLPTEHEPTDGAVADWLYRALCDLPDLPRLRATLLAHELVTAARWRVAAPYVLRLVALDRQGTLAILLDEYTASAEGGPDDPGLVLVDGLATRWGVEHRAHGRTTWAELTIDAPSVRLLPPGQPPAHGRWGS